VRALLRELPWLEGVDRRFPSNNLLWNCFWGPVFQVVRGWRVFHGPGYTAPLVNFSKVVLTIHDVSYLVNPSWYPHRISWSRLAYYRASIRRADRILVPSAFSERELTRLFPGVAGKVRLVPNGVGGEFFPDPSAGREALKVYSLPEKFLLHVGDLHPRRNIAMIVELGRVTGIPVVLVGRCLVGSPPAAAGVFHLQGIPLEHLRGLYGSAAALVYASVYEGFGLPLLEAMACGLPVVASNRGSIPEVCGDAAILVEPELNSFREGLMAAADRRNDLIRRGRERAAMFSWSASAKGTAAVYEELS